MGKSRIGLVGAATIAACLGGGGLGFVGFVQAQQSGFQPPMLADASNAAPGALANMVAKAASAVLAVGGIQLDGGTKTATASAGAVTLNKMAGVVTSESLTTAAGADYTLTLTNADVAAADQVFASVQNGSNTQGDLTVGSVTPGAGTAVIIVRNMHATQALNGTIKVSFAVLKN